jgi:peptidoglycan-associated lipoprotein
MSENPLIEITIAGHADERGTREYNLALGQRRAESVADYLVLKGISRSRLTIKSYGEEMPAVSGSNERSWGRNRRAEIN